MPTFALPVVPKLPGRIDREVLRPHGPGKADATELISVGEKVCTQFAPVSFVGYDSRPGKLIGSTGVSRRRPSTSNRIR